MREPIISPRRRTANSAAKVTAKIYGVMAVTTLGTFATLISIYELFFRPDIFV